MHETTLKLALLTFLPGAQALAQAALRPAEQAHQA